jgi:hypothetical protein
MQVMRVLLPVLVLVGACGSGPRRYVEADEATRLYVAPKLRQYAGADNSLSPEKRREIEDTLDTWELRTRRALANTD